MLCKDVTTNLLLRWSNFIMARVLDEQDASKPFPRTNCGKPEHILVLILISVYMLPFWWLQFGFLIKESDGGLFNLHWLYVKIFILGFVYKLLFAADCALDAQWELSDCFAKCMLAFGLAINLRKPMTIYWTAPAKPYVSPEVKIGKNSTQSSNLTILVEFWHVITMRQTKSKGILFQTKLKVYNCHIQNVDYLFLGHLQKAMKVRWQDHI